MNSFHVIDHLPLWVEGDLPETDSHRVSEHLLGCTSCRATAEALRESQSWLKDSPPPPFDEDDLMELRRKVLKRLPSECLLPSRTKAIRFFHKGPLVAAAAVLLLILLTPWIRVQKANPQAEPEKRASSSLNPRLALPPTEVRAPVQASPRVAPRSLPIRMPVMSPNKAMGQEIPGETPVTQVRIEMQTSNPAIRIIWLPRSPSEPPSTPEHSRLS